MAKQGTAKREAVRIEGASWTAGSRTGRASIPTAARPGVRAAAISLPGSVMRVLAAAVLVMASIGAGSAAAHAETEPAPTPPPSNAPSDPAIAAPTFTAPLDGAVITSASTTVAGTKTAGSGVQIQNGGGDVLCIVDASPATSFSCATTLGSGRSVTIRAIATDAGGSDAGTRTSITVTSVPPPTILSGGSAPGNGLVRGTGIPGATVTVAASSGESCTSGADTSGAWACLLSGQAADGTYRMTATQVAAFAPSARSDASADTRLVLDRTAPSPPALSSPTNGSSLAETNVRFDGTGENGATVTVFAGSASICQAIVSGGRWSCVAARLPAGDLRVVAIQRDTANNTSSGSDVVDLVVGGATTAPVPTPTTPTPEDDPAETPAPVEPQPTPAPAEPSPGTIPSPSAPSPEASPWGGDAWDASTPFTTPRAPLFSTGSVSGWLGTFLLAVLALAGIALVTRLASGAGTAAPAAMTRTVRHGAAPSSTGLRFGITGRNRRNVADRERVVSATTSISTVVAALVAVAGLMILSKPVDGTPAYARLLFASVTATFLVALVSVAVPAAVARLLGAGRLHTTVDPRGFAIIAASVAVSRILGLEPPLLFALVLTASTAMVVRRAAEGRVAASRILALLGLGGASWALGSVLTLDAGFASSLVTETLNLVTAAALGSAAVMMVPFGASAGRSLWAASRPAWFGVGFVVVTVELVLLGSRTPEMTSSVTAVGTVVAVAVIVVSASVWIWRRHVAPILADEDVDGQGGAG